MEHVRKIQDFVATLNPGKLSVFEGAGALILVATMGMKESHVERKTAIEFARGIIHDTYTGRIPWNT